MLELMPWIAAALYVVAAVLLSRRLFADTKVVRGLPVTLAAAAVAAHAVPLVAGYTRGGPDLHFFASLSLVALIIAALTTAVSWWRSTEPIGIVAYPIAAISAVAGALHVHAGASASEPWQIVLHVVFALLAFAVLAIAALVAIMLLVQEHALRTHRVAPLMRAFPPITRVDALLFHLIGSGFVLLTLTVLTGTLFIEDWFAQHLVHKTVLTLAAWVVFGMLLFGRWRWGWRGRQAARLTLAGMLLLLLGFLGTKFVLEILLQRGA